MSNKLIAVLLGLFFFIAGLFTLPHYGINWDTINHLPRGQAYLHFFLTGRKDFLDLVPFRQYWQDSDTLWIKSDIPAGEIPARSIYQSDGTTFNWFMEHDGGGHPPLSDIFSSFSNLIFFQKLRLVNDIDSYRIYGVFLGASLIALIYFWVSKIYGRFAGFVSSLSLGLYPLFWSELHFNTEKDVPETVFWSFALYCLWRGVINKSWKWFGLFGVFFGFALGTKFNVLFSLFIIFPWILVYLLRSRFRDFKRLIVWLFVSLTTALVIFVGSWPYLWADPLTRVFSVVKFYKTIGLTETIDPKFIGILGLNTYPVSAITYTTPIAILLFTVFGIMIAVKRIGKDKSLSSLLFLLWFIVPIVRVSLPGTNIYGGTRQIMEYIPAMAILAGIGGSFLKNWLGKICGSKVSYLIILGLFVPVVLGLVQIHPNENVYFNQLIGGLSGAKLKKFPYWGNSFGAAYRQGVSFINKNAEQGARVVLAYELLPNIPSIWMRRDISFHNSSRSGYLRRGEYAITLTYQGTRERSYYDSYLENFVEPVYQAAVDGIPVLKVWKNDDAHLKLDWKEEVLANVVVKKSESGLMFDLRKVYKLSRLEINYNGVNCDKLSSGVVRISKDGKKWENLPGVLPNAWRISALKEQPADGHFIEPFVGQEAGFIDLVLTPEDTCLKSVRSFKVFRLM